VLADGPCFAEVVPGAGNRSGGDRRGTSAFPSGRGEGKENWHHKIDSPTLCSGIFADMTFAGGLDGLREKKTSETRRRKTGAHAASAARPIWMNCYDHPPMAV